MFVDCDKSIVTPDERITLPVFSMLCCVASASRLSCDRVCKAVIPNIVKTFQEHPQVSMHVNYDYLSCIVIPFFICMVK